MRRRRRKQEIEIGRDDERIESSWFPECEHKCQPSLGHNSSTGSVGEDDRDKILMEVHVFVQWVGHGRDGLIT